MTQTLTMPGSLPSRRNSGIPNSVLGMLVFISTEIMYFMALISAHTVIKSGSGIWSPPESVRLPILATGFNTLVLLSSGVLLFLAGKNFNQQKCRILFALSIVAGCFFVSLQGFEWYHLLKYGLTLTSGIYGACFFLLVGSHGLHAASAVVAMIVVYQLMIRGRISRDQFTALQIFWFFIVRIWPLFYAVVYF